MRDPQVLVIVGWVATALLTFSLGRLTARLDQRAAADLAHKLRRIDDTRAMLLGMLRVTEAFAAGDGAYMVLANQRLGEQDFPNADPSLQCDENLVTALTTTHPEIWRRGFGGSTGSDWSVVIADLSKLVRASMARQEQLAIRGKPLQHASPDQVRRMAAARAEMFRILHS